MITTKTMPEAVHTRVCITGGGPAGLMLGYLLARAGVDVVVLEKHGDFLRDFRGDTIHPSTMEALHELAWGSTWRSRTPSRRRICLRRRSLRDASPTSTST